MLKQFDESQNDTLLFTMQIVDEFKEEDKSKWIVIPKETERVLRIIKRLFFVRVLLFFWAKF